MLRLKIPEPRRRIAAFFLYGKIRNLSLFSLLILINHSHVLGRVEINSILSLRWRSIDIILRSLKLCKIILD